MRLSVTVGRRSFRFADLNELLAKANRPRSGDRLAGLGAGSQAERVAAQRLLAEVPLAELRAHPALPCEADGLSRVVEEGLDETAYARVAGWSVGELRDFVLAADPSELSAERLGFGLTPEMAAAVAKLSSNLDLVQAGARLPVTARANTTLGRPGTLGVRVQPNHPTDDLDEILAQTAEGLAYGCGDALVGVNPARDDADTVRRLLEALDAFVREHDVPTQVCVLAHVTTQMELLRQGAPMGLLFQSLAGTEAACRAFGITIEMLDEAAELARAHCGVEGPNAIYFETGQGSELSSQTHQGIDQVTLEARCYGLARRYGAVRGEHGRRLHRPGVPLRLLGGATRRARGPLHGQAPRGADGRRRLRDQPHARRPGRPREPGAPARRGRRELLHGCAHGGRRPARLPLDLVPRPRRAAGDARQAPGPGVRALARGTGIDEGRSPDAPRRGRRALRTPRPCRRRGAHRAGARRHPPPDPRAARLRCGSRRRAGRGRGDAPRRLRGDARRAARHVRRRRPRGVPPRSRRGVAGSVRARPSACGRRHLPT